MDTILAMEENFDFSGENDRRKEVRRVLKDRRDKIRYEIEKDDRRSGEEQRKVKATVKEDKMTIDDQDDSDEQTPESVVAKISSFFKR